LVIVSQTLSRPVIINTNRHYDYDSLADFDTQFTFNRWQTTMFKASWIQSTLYDYRLDGPAIREPNLEIDD
jgi:hypothetical protein